MKRGRVEGREGEREGGGRDLFHPAEAISESIKSRLTVPAGICRFRIVD